MLKTISAALVAVSVLAAPALAGTPARPRLREQDHAGACHEGEGKSKR